MRPLTAIDSLQQFTSAPTMCQFAKDGLWESAWSFPIDRPPPLPELDAYLAHRTEIAFEAFFGDAFFGVRLSGTASEVKAFSVRCLKALRAQASFFDTLQREIGCPCLGQKPDFVEVGCVNAWRSIGAFRMTDLVPTTPEFELLWSQICNSSVGRDTEHAKAIEFAFKHPLEHWFGIPITVDGGPNLISKALLVNADQTLARWGFRRSI